MRSYRNRRRAIAIVACALWLFGVEALPALHEATHDREHTHARDGSIEHHHGERVHSHAVARPKPRKQQRQLAFDNVQLAHAADGLAHHAVAYSHAAVPLFAPLPVDRPSLLVEHAPEVLLGGFALAHPLARGPPASSRA